MDDPRELLEKGFVGRRRRRRAWTLPLRLGIPGEELALDWIGFLSRPTRKALTGRRVAVIGGGAVAADCAETAARRGAAVEMICLETPGEMPLTPEERDGLLASRRPDHRPLGRDVDPGRGGPENGPHPADAPAARPGVQPRAGWSADPRQPAFSRSFDEIVIAIGARSRMAVTDTPGVYYAGDMAEGPGTVVSAVASGKNAAQRALDAPRPQAHPEADRRARAASSCPAAICGPCRSRPISSAGTILSPFLLSAAPPTDGFEQMRAAYEAGWAGGVMKTAFDGVPIHIPAEYMFVFGRDTYGNCDNVSGHALDRVCREIEPLNREFPDRLTIASTGGPVTGDDESDRGGLAGQHAQARSRRERMAIEYSLSCPQGGDGTRGRHRLPGRRAHGQDHRLGAVRCVAARTCRSSSS